MKYYFDPLKNISIQKMKFNIFSVESCFTEDEIKIYQINFNLMKLNIENELVLR